MIQTLTRDYQVVLVASESCGDTSVWPGLLASGCDIITVGAVQSDEGDFGRRFAWSAGRDAA